MTQATKFINAPLLDINVWSLLSYLHWLTLS